MVAQRLVRRLCDNCKQAVPTSQYILDTFEEDIDTTSVINCHEPVGCDLCNQTGYKGRLAICEVMLVNEDFRTEVTVGNSNIHQLALKYGMTSMVIDGFEKVKNGLTSIDELFRVVLE